MTLQQVMDTAAKYPWRYGHGSYKKCPLTKLCGVKDAVAAAAALGCTFNTVVCFTEWWDGIFDKGSSDKTTAMDAIRLRNLGLRIPAGPRTIRLRKKTKRVHAQRYLRTKATGYYQ